MLRNTLIKYFFTKYLSLQKKKKRENINKYSEIQAYQSQFNHTHKKLKSKMWLDFFKYVHNLWFLKKFLSFNEIKSQSVHLYKHTKHQKQKPVHTREQNIRVEYMRLSISYIICLKHTKSLPLELLSSRIRGLEMSTKK